MLSQPISTQYVHALLWGTGMVTTLMPFDVEPKTLGQTLVTILLVWIGLCMNIFVISAATSALQARRVPLASPRVKASRAAR